MCTYYKFLFHVYAERHVHVYTCRKRIQISIRVIFGTRVPVYLNTAMIKSTGTSWLFSRISKRTRFAVPSFFLSFFLSYEISLSTAAEDNYDNVLGS